MFVVVETYGEDLVAAELEAVGDRGLNMEPLWPAMILKLEAIEREQFSTEGARSGNKWEENSQPYKWRKWNRGDNPMVMRATDALYDALTGPSDASIRTTTQTTLEFGADLVQFRVHQDYNPGSEYPQRTPIDLTQSDVRDFAMVMMDYVMGTRSRTGAPIDPVTKRFAKGRNPLR